MELKTLKDFDYKNDNYSLIVVKELRQEAIKWIKDIQEGHSFEPIPMAKEEFTNDKTVNCFKCFFNITNKDLEEE